MFSTTLLSLRTITRRCQKSRFFTCSNGFSAVFPPVSKIRVSFFALRSRFLSRFQWFPPRTLQTFFEFSSKRRLPSCRSAPFATVVWSQPSVLSVNSVGCLCANAAKEPLPKSLLWQAATLRTGQRMPLRLSQGRNRSQRRSSCSVERARPRWTRRARWTHTTVRGRGSRTSDRGPAPAPLPRSPAWRCIRRRSLRGYSCRLQDPRTGNVRRQMW